MNRQQTLDLFEINDLKDLPDAIMKILFGDTEQRNSIYFELLNLNKHDLSFDWFSQLYEEELAERKFKKQDFTPNSISNLASLLTGNKKGWILEPTAGNGSMIIADWWNRCKSVTPYEHFPSENMVCCWELSDRSVPILLLNLSIRGIMGYVYHGNVLTMTVKNKYVLLNRNNNTLGFSEITHDVEKDLFIYKDGKSTIK